MPSHEWVGLPPAVDLSPETEARRQWSFIRLDFDFRLIRQTSNIKTEEMGKHWSTNATNITRFHGCKIRWVLDKGQGLIH